MARQKYCGSGTYGCVLHPNFACDNVPESNQYVSKIFPLREDADKENQLTQIVQKIDPKNVFSRKFIHKCKAFISQDNKEEVGKCSKTIDMWRMSGAPQNDYVDQLVFEDGGVSLLKRYGAFKTFPEMIRFMWPIFQGVYDVAQHGYVQFDIKPANILFREDNKKMVIIDFGMLHEIKDTYDKNSSFYSNDIDKILTFEYMYFPPEFRLFIHYVHYRNVTRPSYEKVISSISPFFHDYTDILNQIIDHFEERGHKDISQQIIAIVDCNIGKSVRYAEIMNSCKYIEANMRKPSNVFRFFNDNAHKIDVYSLGVSILEVFLLMVSSPSAPPLPSVLAVNENVEFYKSFFNLLHGMTCFDPSRRLSPEQTLKEYKRIRAFIQTSKKEKQSLKPLNRESKKVSVQHDIIQQETEINEQDNHNEDDEGENEYETKEESISEPTVEQKVTKARKRKTRAKRKSEDDDNNDNDELTFRTRIRKAVEDGYMPEEVKNPISKRKLKADSKTLLGLLKSGQLEWGFWESYQTVEKVRKKPKERSESKLSKADLVYKIKELLKKRQLPKHVLNPDTDRTVSVTGDTFIKLVKKYGFKKFVIKR